MSESVEALAEKVRACEVPGLCVQCLARLRAAFVTHYQTTGLGPSYVEREANAALDAILARLAEAEKDRDMLYNRLGDTQVDRDRYKALVEDALYTHLCDGTMWKRHARTALDPEQQQ